MTHAIGLLAAHTLPVSIVVFLIVYFSSKYILKRKMLGVAAVFMFTAIWAISMAVQVATASKSRTLTEAELQSITGEARISQGTFRGNIHNGNRSVEVVSIEIVVVNDFNQLEESHIVTVTIPPLSSRDITFKYGDSDYKPHSYY